MKNKFTVMLFLCVLLACALAGNVFADDKAADPMVPEELAAKYNEALGTIIQQRHGDNLSADELAEIKTYLSLSFTENIKDISYFNNPDWKLEMSGYYEDRDADQTVTSHSITFSYVNDLDQSLAADVHFAFLSALTACDPTLTFEEIVDRVNNAIQQTESGLIQTDLGDYQLTLFSYQGRMGYALQLKKTDN